MYILQGEFYWLRVPVAMATAMPSTCLTMTMTITLTTKTPRLQAPETPGAVRKEKNRCTLLGSIQCWKSKGRKFRFWITTIRSTGEGLTGCHADEQDVRSDGFPKFLIVKFHDWKKRSKDDVQRGAYAMVIWRNYLDGKYCLLTWLLTWLTISGITQGPIFPRFANRSHTRVVDCVGVREETEKGVQTIYYVASAQSSSSSSASSSSSGECLYIIMHT